MTRIAGFSPHLITLEWPLYCALPLCDGQAPHGCRRAVRHEAHQLCARLQPVRQAGLDLGLGEEEQRGWR